MNAPTRRLYPGETWEKWSDNPGARFTSFVAAPLSGPATALMRSPDIPTDGSPIAIGAVATSPGGKNRAAAVAMIDHGTRPKRPS
jgi:hypothetical protein